MKDCCAITCINQEKVDKVRKLLEPADTILKLTQIFKVLSDPTRAKIISALSKEELCVCDVAHVLGISQSATSHQLRILRNIHLAKYRKDGKIAYYSIDDEHVNNLFAEGVRHTMGQ